LNCNNTLCTNRKIVIDQIKDRFQPGAAAKGGWSDLVLSCHFADSMDAHVFEIQIHHKQFAATRAELGGHSIYAIFRCVAEALEVAGIDLSTNVPPQIMALQQMLNDAIKAERYEDCSSIKLRLQEIEALIVEKKNIERTKNEALANENYETCKNLAEEMKKIDLKINYVMESQNVVNKSSLPPIPPRRLKASTPSCVDSSQQSGVGREQDPLLDPRRPHRLELQDDIVENDPPMNTQPAGVSCGDPPMSTQPAGVSCGGQTLQETPFISGLVPGDQKPVLALVQQGDEALAKGDIYFAEAAYRQAIEVDPKCHIAHNQLIDLMCVNMKNVTGAEAEYRQLVSSNESNGVARTQLAMILHIYKKDLVGAEKEVLRAIGIDPNDAMAHNRLGCLLFEKNDRAGAMAAFQQALEIDPCYSLARSNLERARGDEECVVQ